MAFFNFEVNKFLNSKGARSQFCITSYIRTGSHIFSSDKLYCFTLNPTSLNMPILYASQIPYWINVNSNLIKNSQNPITLNRLICFFQVINFIEKTPKLNLAGGFSVNGGCCEFCRR